MSKLDQFMGDVPLPEGLPWSAAVRCQTCNEDVYEQTYYPRDSILAWKCSSGHKSIMENFSVF